MIIPTHNRAGLLREALDSVLAQEGAGKQFEMEVIVVDDASTDATPEVAGHYPGLRYIRLPVNQGMAAAKNAGLDVSTGRYIAFLDDDDLWLPHKLSSQVATLEAHPEAGVAYAQVIITFKGRESIYPRSTAPSGSIFSTLLFTNLCMLPAVLARRDALNGVGGIDVDVGPTYDYDMWLRLAFAHPFIFVPEVLAVYRLSSEGGMFTSVVDGSYSRSLRLTVERALSLLPDTKASDKIKLAARANVELSLAGALVNAQQPELAWQRMLVGLRMLPSLGLEPHRRSDIAHITGRYAATFASPFAATNRLWKEIMEPYSRLGFRERIHVRQLLADVYWEVAIARGMGIGCPVSVGAAAGALARSIFQHPLDLPKWKALARFAVRPVIRSFRSTMLPHL